MGREDRTRHRRAHHSRSPASSRTKLPLASGSKNSDARLEAAAQRTGDPGGALGARSSETPPRRTAHEARECPLPDDLRGRRTSSDYHGDLHHGPIPSSQTCLGMATALTTPIHRLRCTLVRGTSRRRDRETTVRDDRRMTNRLRRAKLRHPNACERRLPHRQVPHPLLRLRALAARAPGPAAWGSPGSPARSPTKPVATASRCTCASHRTTSIARGDALLASFAKHRRPRRLRPRQAQCRPSSRLGNPRGPLRDRRSPVSSREKWHDLFGDPTFADAILDRLVHNAYKLKLKGGSMRKKKASLTQPDH